MKKLLSTFLAILMVITIIPLSSFQTSAAASDGYTKPSISSKYYTSTTNPFTSSGYSGQCTWFVWGRVWEKLNIKLPAKTYNGSNSSELTNGKTYTSFRNNAYTWWYVNKGLEIYEYGQTPKKNSIAVWDGYYGGVRTGHVAFVEYIDGDKVYFNEANYSKSEQYDGAIEYLTKSGMKKRGSFTLLGYIYVGGDEVTTNSLSFNYSANGGTVATSNTYKTTDALNLRSSASTSGTVLLTIPEGTTITVTSTKTGGGYTWGKTTYGGKTGWCALDYTIRQGYYVSSDMIYQYSNKKLVSHSWDYGTGGANGLWNAASFGLTKNGYTFGGWSKDKTITDSSKIFDENDNTLKAEDIDASVANGSKTITLYAVWVPVEIQSIKVNTLPNKTVYRIGESFDSTGLTLTATYSDKSTKNITSGYTINGFSSSTVGQKNVTITYEGKSVAISVTVEEAPHTCAFTTFSHYETVHPHYAVYECNCGNKKTDTTKPTTVDSCEICNPPHICAFTTFSHYEVVHPHYAVYVCSCGTPKVDISKTTEFENCEDCNPSAPNYDFSISIQEPSRTIIRCKDGIILHANVTGTLPEGAKVVWTTSNKNFTTKQLDDGSFQIISNNNGYTTVTVSIVDVDGDVLATDSIEMYSKAGIFDKLGGFFRSLFGATKIYEN